MVAAIIVILFQLPGVQEVLENGTKMADVRDLPGEANVNM